MNERQKWSKRFGNVARPEYFFWAGSIIGVISFIGGEAPSVPEGNLAAAAALTTPHESPFDAIELAARSASVYDAEAGRFLFEKDAERLAPLASLTKIMTAVAALSLVPETTLVTITPRALAEEGDTELAPGETWVLRDLLAFMLLESSNDAAYAVASEIGTIGSGSDDREVGRGFFIARMNVEARRLGLPRAYFLTESGLDFSASTPGAAGSAKEAALMLAHASAAHPALFQATRFDELTLRAENGHSRPVSNTNKSTGKIPLLIASKTGYTDLAGGNLVIAFDAGFNHPVIIAVLGSTAKERFTDAEKLAWSTLEYLADSK